VRILVTLCLLALQLLPAGARPAAAQPWPWPDQHRDRLVWVHPLVNYAFDPAWQRAWDQERARGRSLRTSVGSVSTDDFQTLMQVNVSEPVGGSVRFLYRLDWRDALHVDAAEEQHWLGFGLAVAPGLEAELQAHPAADKEDLDLRAGLLLTDRDRGCYLRLAARWDDPLYGRKNARGGLSRDESVAAQWELRWTRGRWEVAGEGRYGSPWSRTYPDSARSPDLAAASGQRGEGSLRLRRLGDGDRLLQAGLSHYDFRETRDDHGGDPGQSYANEWLHAHALAVVRLSPRTGLRPELHWLRQWARAAGPRTFRHTRQDLFPAVFVQWRADARTTWELGYMAVHYGWEHSGGDDTGTTDKVKLGWIFAPTPAARLQVSLSHEVDLDRFGGGNIQYQMLF
jgi:hypothetical protein